jgi:hypothetical protein
MKTIALILIVINLILPVWAANLPFSLISQESFSRHTLLQGKQDQPIIIQPLSEIKLSDRTEKLVVIPEEIKLKEEIEEFHMFRNRYVLFGLYLSLALYYNWLTRYR